MGPIVRDKLGAKNADTDQTLLIPAHLKLVNVDSRTAFARDRVNLLRAHLLIGHFVFGRRWPVAKTMRSASRGALHQPKRIMLQRGTVTSWVFKATGRLAEALHEGCRSNRSSSSPGQRGIPRRL